MLLDESEARERRFAHEGRVDVWIRPHLDRRSRGVAHPVEDFLFTYYAPSPATLRRWHPGAGTAVAGSEGRRLAALPGYVLERGVAAVDEDQPPIGAVRLQWIRRLLSATDARAPVLSCFGRHEWAMVYRAAERRHEEFPLRLGRAATDAVVEDAPLACTHHDALRFFTPAAAPRNAFRTSRDTQHELEQPGCLHAGMDLYKWASQLVPLVSAELVADCFELARDIREQDMRASPYDLTSIGYLPIAIETPEGRAEYAAGQRTFAARSTPLRRLLIDACDRAIRRGLRAGVALAAAQNGK